MVDMSEEVVTEPSQPRAASGAWSVELLTIIGVGLLAGGLVWWFTPHGLVVADDTVSYYSIAKHLSHGLGLTAAFADPNSHLSIAHQIADNGRIPMTEWPPGYPVLLAIGAKLGLSVPAAARAVAVLGAVLLVGSVTWTARRLFRLSLGASVAVAGLSLLSPNLQDISRGPLGGTAIALSESTYIALSALAVVIGVSVLRRPSWWRIAGVCVLLVVATLVRSAAPALGLALGAGALFGPANAGWWTRRRRIGAAAALVACPPIAMAAWQVVNRVVWGATSTVRTVGWHPDHQVIDKVSHIVAAWFGLSPTAPTWLAVIVTGAVVGAPIVVALVPSLRRRVWPEDSAGGVAAVVCGVVIVGNLGIVVFTRFVLDQTTGIDPRHLGTVQPFAYLLAAAVLVGAAEHQAGRHWTRWPVTPPQALVAVGCLVLAVSPIRSLHGERTFWSTAAARTATSPLTELPPDVTFVTSGPSAFWMASGRGSLLLPVPRYVTDGKPNPDYREGLELIVELSHRTPVVLLIDAGPLADTRAADDATAYLTAHGGFVSVGPCGKSMIAWVQPTSSIAPEVHRRCSGG